MEKKYAGTEKRKITECQLDEEVTDLLKKFGVPAHIKGYRYLRGAIILSVKNNILLEGITKDLYPTVAKMFKTTSSRTERAIRHAIEVAWERVDINEIEMEFGSTIDASRGKPTNSEFIAFIVDKFRNVVIEK